MPDWKALVRRYLEGCAVPPEFEAGIVEELAQHLEQRYDELLNSGISPEVATHQVASELSGESLRAQVIQKAKQYDRCRRTQSMPAAGSWWAAAMYDLRYAWRGLRLSPGFTITALLSLALGIGANTAIFEILNALRLRALPVSHPEQLAEVHMAAMKGARGSFWAPRPVLTHPQWEQLRDHQTVLSGIFAWYWDEFNTASSGESHLISGLEVSGDYFSVLGLQPAAGRLFRRDDDVAGCGTPAAVISYAYWKSAFASSDVVGRTITLERHPFQIVGVAPKTFTGLEIGRTFDVAVPLCAEPLLMGEYNRLNSGRDWWLTVMGRLKPDVTIARASSELQSLSPGVFSATVPPKYPPDAVEPYRNSLLNAYSAATGVSQLRKEYSSSLWLLLAIAAVVTLIACANLANLLLARASKREREFALRLALGASRRRLISQLMVECGLLAAAGAVLALALSTLLSQHVVSFLRTQSNPVFLDVPLDSRVFLFTIAVGFLTCLLFGLAPALRASQADPGTALKNSSRGAIGGRHHFLLRRILVTTQMTLSLILVISALLFTRSLHNLLTVDAGFDQDGLILAGMDLSALKLPKEQRTAFRHRIVEQLKAQPGIENASETVIRPLSGGGWDDQVSIKGNAKSEKQEAWFNRVGSEFFSTMHIPFRSGRTFDQSDTPTSPLVAIVNESFARAFAGGENPVGKVLHVEPTPSSPARDYEIVGFVKDAKYRSLKEEMLPQIYLANSQDDDPEPFTRLLIRSHIGAGDTIHEVNSVLSALAPESTVSFRVLRQDVKDGLAQERLMSTLALMFGVLASVLATVGLYGVIAYMLALRTNEIGIRIALGASKPRVMRMILIDAVQMVFTGLLAGVLISLLVGCLVAAMLFGLKPYDPGVMFAACSILGAIGIAASLVPALRATRLDPMTALRQE